MYRNKELRRFLLPQKNDDIHFENHVKWKLCHAIRNKMFTVNSESREAIRKNYPVNWELECAMRHKIITATRKITVTVNTRVSIGDP